MAEPVQEVINPMLVCIRCGLNVVGEGTERSCTCGGLLIRKRVITAEEAESWRFPL